MAGNGKRCARCGAIAVPKDSDFCKPCRIGEEEGEDARKAYLQRITSKGGRNATSKRSPPGLKPGELGPLESHEDAKRWQRIVGEAVATGRLSTSAGNTVIRAASEWVKAHAEQVVAEDLEKLREEVERLKGEMDAPWK